MFERTDALDVIDEEVDPSDAVIVADDKGRITRWNEVPFSSRLKLM